MCKFDYLTLFYDIKVGNLSECIFHLSSFPGVSLINLAYTQNGVYELR